MMGIITNKAKFINQIMTSKDPVRVSEDVDEMVLTYSQMQAIASGNPGTTRGAYGKRAILRCLKQMSITFYGGALDFF